MELTRRGHSTTCTYTCQDPQEKWEVRSRKSEVAHAEQLLFKIGTAAQAQHFRLRLLVARGSGIVRVTLAGTSCGNLLSAPG
jgi:hypothetical protein